MSEFVYNNAKNASTGHTPFELNYAYNPRILFEKDVNLCLRFCFVDKLAEELRKLIEVYCKNLFYA